MKVKIKVLKTFKVGEVELIKDSVLSVEEVNAVKYIADGSAELYNEVVEKVETEKEVKKIVDTKDIEADTKSVVEVVHAKKGSIKDLQEKLSALKSKKIESITIKAAGASEGTASDGGNLVYQIPIDLQGKLELKSVIYDKCTKSNDFADGVFGKNIPYRNESTISETSAPRTYEPGEGTAITVTKMAFGLHDLKLGSDKVLVPATDELLSDVSWVENYLMSSMIGKLYWKRDYNALFGTYSAAVQGCIGIFDAGAANFYVEPVAHAATYTGAIINGIISGIAHEFRNSSEWYMSNSMHSTLVGQLGSGTTVSTQPIFSDNNMKLMGKPINILSQMSAFGSSGDILYGDFSQYMFAQKGDIVITMSKDYAFNSDETYYKASIRYEGAPIYREVAPKDSVTVAAFSSTSGT